MTWDGKDRRKAERRGKCMDCPVTEEGYCVHHEANMQTIADLKKAKEEDAKAKLEAVKEDSRSRLKTALTLVATIGPLLAAAIGYGISLSNSVTKVDTRISLVSEKLDSIQGDMGTWVKMQTETSTRQQDVLRRLDKLESKR